MDQITIHAPAPREFFPVGKAPANRDDFRDARPCLNEIAQNGLSFTLQSIGDGSRGVSGKLSIFAFHVDGFCAQRIMKLNAKVPQAIAGTGCCAHRVQFALEHNRRREYRSRRKEWRSTSRFSSDDYRQTHPIGSMRIAPYVSLILFDQFDCFEVVGSPYETFMDHRNGTDSCFFHQSQSSTSIEPTESLTG